ncbi:NUDIX domain-containing protein [Kineococcus glutinatus]|uniref:NUDIX domain-containing protein n=1 Tax=Kineococcus glutinatus TaxID=1070872 RepID=UPI003CD073DD
MALARTPGPPAGHGGGDELVALLDPAADPGPPGTPGLPVTGAAPRRRVRRLNLPHAATGVLLRDGRGRVLVHRRTTTKDVHPGLLDCLAGGVVGAGEDAGAAAARELAEELGVRGAPLRPLLRTWYRDEHTWYLACVYEVVHDVAVHGELVLQPAEVACAGWVEPDALAALLRDPAGGVVPDSRALLLGAPALLAPWA